MDPIAVINRIMPRPESLDDLERNKDFLQLSKAYLSSEVGHRSRDRNESAIESGERAPEQMKELTAQLEQMKTVAATTQHQVQNLTMDIKKLDRTKDNLVQSVTVLKRLQMLTKLYSQLESLLKSRQYREMYGTMAAAEELVEYFRDFRVLTQVSRLSKQVSEMHTQISEQINRDIRLFVEKHQDLSSGQLSWACLCIKDSMAVIDWYTAYQLRDYTSVFRIGEEAAGLDNVGRRYAFLNKILHKHAEIASAFPDSWDLGYKLALAACNQTRNDIGLMKFGQDQQSVQLLLDALQETTEFEKQLKRKFKEHSSDFDGIISKAFVPHLNVWVDFHDRTLGEKIARYNSPDWNEEDGGDVLASSADLFMYYRQAIDLMSKLTVGQPLISLAKVFSKRLKQYNGVLRGYIPRSEPLSHEELNVTGLILKTADYCITTTGQLQQTLDGLIGDAVSYDDANNEFYATVNECLSTLVGYVDSQLRTSWREMANTNWSRLNQDVDQSNYVPHLCHTIKQSTDSVLEVLSKASHERLVCDRVVERVSLAFLETSMVRVRPLTAVVAEQLLLDLYAVKETLLNLNGTQAFRTSCANHVVKVEHVLKVLLTETRPEVLVQNYLLLIKDRSVSNFRKILEVKGVRITSKYVDLFREKAAEQVDLPEESQLLASVDMNSRQGTPRVASPSPIPPAIPFFDRETQPMRFDFRRIGDFLRRD